MRRLAGWTLLFVFVLSLFGCGKTGGDMRVRGIDSEIYTDEDYLAAVQAVIAGFRDFQGCTLKEISYAGDETVRKEQEYILSFGDYDEGIVLLSSFTVDEHGGDGSLEPNHTYTRREMENRNQRLRLNTIVKSPLRSEAGFRGFYTQFRAALALSTTAANAALS